MKITLAQIEVKSGAVAENTLKMLTCIEEAKAEQSDVIVFPEMSDTGYDMNVILKTATEWSTGVVPALQAAAKKHSVHVIAGVSEKNAEGVFNSVASINREGKITGSYRKTHLITAEPMFEHHFLKPGNTLGLLEVEGHKVGIMTCYEIRFPEIARSLALAGAEVIFVNSAWPLVRVNHWETLLLARAIENQVFVAAVNRLGNDTGVQFGGTSLVIGPYGNILSSGTQIHESKLTVKLDFDLVRTVRSQIKVFQDRRPDLYRF